jgi:hypothetical protein
MRADFIPDFLDFNPRPKIDFEFLGGRAFRLQGVQQLRPFNGLSHNYSRIVARTLVRSTVSTSRLKGERGFDSSCGAKARFFYSQPTYGS